MRAGRRGIARGQRRGSRRRGARHVERAGASEGVVPHRRRRATLRRRSRGCRPGELGCGGFAGEQWWSGGRLGRLEDAGDGLEGVVGRRSHDGRLLWSEAHGARGMSRAIRPRLAAASLDSSEARVLWRSKATRRPGPARGRRSLEGGAAARGICWRGRGAVACRRQVHLAAGRAGVQRERCEGGG